MTEVLKYPIPNRGKKIVFKLRDKAIEVSKFLFAKYSNKFRNIEYLKRDEYTIKSDVSYESLKSFISACQGKPFALTPDNVYDIYLLSQEFDTPNVSNEINTFYDNNGIEFIIKCILTKDRNYNQNIIEYAAQKFNDLIKDVNFLKADRDCIQQILENTDINLIDPLLFYEFAKKYYSDYRGDKKDVAFLFRYINLIDLPIDSIIEFASLDKFPEELLSINVLPFIKKICTDFQAQQRSINEFNGTLQNIANEIVETKNKLDEAQKTNARLLEINRNFEKKFNEKYEKCVDFHNKNSDLLKQLMVNYISNAENNPLCGVFHDFKMCSDIKKELEIITPDKENPDFPISNIIDTSPNFLSMSYYMKVENEKDNWLTFHLLKKKIKLYGFSIRTNEIGRTIAHPRSFEIFGSNDNKNFTSLFSFEDKKQELYNEGKVQFFKISEEKTVEYYSYIRYRQYKGHCPYYDNDKIISLSAFELFGMLDPKT